MGWKGRTVLALAIAIFVAGCLFLGYMVRARYQANEYRVRVAAAFNAAMLVNGDETYTDPQRAVIATSEGRRYVVVPENYKALVTLLRKENAMPLFRRVGKDAPLTIDICDSARLRLRPDDNGQDGALVEFTTDAGKRFIMHVRGGNIWKQITEYATVGHGENRNLEI